MIRDDSVSREGLELRYWQAPNPASCLGTGYTWPKGWSSGKTKAALRSKGIAIPTIGTLSTVGMTGVPFGHGTIASCLHTALRPLRPGGTCSTRRGPGPVGREPWTGVADTTSYYLIACASSHGHGTQNWRPIRAKYGRHDARQAKDQASPPVNHLGTPGSVGQWQGTVP